MRVRTLLLMAAAPLSIAAPTSARAQATSGAAAPAAEATVPDRSAGIDSPRRDVVVTAVARGRDRLDTAVSTSQLLASDIDKIAPRSLAEVFRNIPGIRSESSSGEGGANLSVRGLPMATGGGKYLQLQEDGLPIVEYGDIIYGNADSFLRADLNLAMIASVRGGSASTFASNSPGGVINLISKTGEIEGGAVQLLEGVDYGEHRLDVDYGGRLGDSWRYHFGGFLRYGQGPRRIGYDGNRGGQFKLNLTREFEGGHVRVYGKALDDETVSYRSNPVRVTGTDADPHYESLTGFDIAHDALYSRYALRTPTLDGDNRPSVYDERYGRRSRVYAAGLEAQATLGGFTVIDRFRYSTIKGRAGGDFPVAVDAAGKVATSIGGAGATLRYATGPEAGRAIAQPALLGEGNGLLAKTNVFNAKLGRLGNVMNDLRGSRLDPIGPGVLTTTLGLYNSRQSVDTDWLYASRVMEVRGGGEAALIDVINANGVPETQSGIHAFAASFSKYANRRRQRVDYFTNAPFGSLNYKIGRLSFGGSLRYDLGHATGLLYSSDLGGGRVGLIARDLNGDGAISLAEQRVAVIPLDRPAPVDYDWHHLSYSSGINFRIAEVVAVFARYSRGGRTNADRLLFSPSLNIVTGRLTNPTAAVDRVDQAEGGLKYRHDHVHVDVTGFWARTGEKNAEPNTPGVFVDRLYRAHGVESEAGLDLGVFHLSAGGTYTDSKIVADHVNPLTIGNVPRRQARFIYQATPELTLGPIELGTNVVGTTSSFTQDVNQLKLPGFTTIGVFATWHLRERLQLAVNSNNLFDMLGFTEAEDAAIPANRIVRARSINGRTTSLALRLQL
jgi:outer membrane receptor protein involved in Fe transport